MFISKLFAPLLMNAGFKPGAPINFGPNLKLLPTGMISGVSRPIGNHTVISRQNS